MFFLQLILSNYLDIPLQHISDKILKSMRRGTTHEKTTKLLKEFRAKVPEMTIRTTLIVGYPGETQENFEELREWVREMRFERLGCFTYSHEENTSAHDLVDDVPAAEKQRRAEEIMEVQQEISLEINQSKEGQILKVLVDKKEAGRYLGRTEFDSVEVDNEVVINTNKRLKPGDFVMVKITKAYDYDLEGELVD